jgi:hypothetical protein
VNKIHRAVIRFMRDHTTLLIEEHAVNLTEELLARQMFANYRHGHGLRLTEFGQQLMQRCFQNFIFENYEKETMQPSRLMFLDRHARMPYFCDPTKIVIYDPLFAVRLRLVAGHLATLMEIDTID